MERFIISWDQTGVEAVVPVNDILCKAQQAEAEKIWRTLADETSPQNPYARELTRIMSHMMMRARANSQRHYEIYLITADTGITEHDIKDMFAKSPQSAAETIRGIGTKLYSDRVNPDQVKIT